MPVSTVNPLVANDADQLIFGIDLDDRQPFHLPWDNYPDIEPDIKQPPLASYDFLPPHQSLFLPTEHNLDDLANWINDPPEVPPSPHSPHSFSPFLDFDQPFSPSSFVLNPLPRSISPSSSYDDSHTMRPRLRSAVVSSAEISIQTPSWVGQLWESTSPTTPTSSSSLSSALRSPSSLNRPLLRHSPLTTDATVRQNRIPIRRLSLSSMLPFHPASAPTTHAESSASMMARNFSSRADSVGLGGDDRDATLRPSRGKRSPEYDAISPSLTISNSTPREDTPLKSVLRPPKLAPSAWQLYFTDWIQKQQASGTRKLNVAQAAKEAGQEYALLSPAEKEPFRRRSQAMKEAREREHDAYMRSLTPEDIKRENAFRAAQRKAGKSRKSNLKDRNAPKKPLSAYFMFLQQIRANPVLVADIFGEETETTKQSVLAAAKWRSMSDAERQPFLAQAEQEKMEYEAARRIYEDGATPGFISNINFSILPGSPRISVVKTESSESESEGSTTDDVLERPARS